MRYLKTVKGSLYFQRAFPKKLHASCKRLGVATIMVKPLGVTADNPEWQIAKAIAEWNDVFEDVCSLVENSNSKALETEAQRKLALSFLKAKDLKPGMFADETDEKAQFLFDYVIEDLFGDDLYQQQAEYKAEGRTPDYSEDFIGTTIDILRASVTVSNRLTFGSAIDKYLDHRKRKAKPEHVKKDGSYCRRFLSAVGDHLLTTENAGMKLKEYRNKLEEEGRRGPTVARMIAPPRAALAYAADKYATDVFVPLIRVEGSTNHKDRYTLTEDEMIELIRYVTAPDCPAKDYVKLFYLVAIHCGAHMLEVRNTLTSDLRRTDAGWQLYLRGSKTSSRPRTVPITDEAATLIRKWMPLEDDVSLLAEAGDITDGAIDVQLSRCIKLVNREATPYSLRHGCRNLAIAKKVGPDVQQLILGWTTGNGGKAQQRYAAAGEANAEQMEVKREAVERMLGRITPVLLARAGGKA